MYLEYFEKVLNWNCNFHPTFISNTDFSYNRCLIFFWFDALNITLIIKRLPYKLHCTFFFYDLGIWECVRLNFKLSFNSCYILYAHKSISLTSNGMVMNRGWFIATRKAKILLKTESPGYEKYVQYKTAVLQTFL